MNSRNVECEIDWVVVWPEMKIKDFADEADETNCGRS